MGFGYTNLRKSRFDNRGTPNWYDRPTYHYHLYDLYFKKILDGIIKKNKLTIKIIKPRIITKNIDNPATNNCAKKTIIKRIVIPKSGCKIKRVDEIINIGKIILKPYFLPSRPLLRNHALITTKNVFKNSDGCIVKPKIGNHLLEPFIS